MGNVTCIKLDSTGLRVLQLALDDGEVPGVVDRMFAAGVVDAYDGLKKEIDGINLEKNIPCPKCGGGNTEYSPVRDVHLECKTCGNIVDELGFD